MKRLLLVTHRPLSQGGGASARWNSLRRRLPEHGWAVDLLEGPEEASAREFSADAEDLRRVARRARVMGRVAAASRPVFALAGVRPDAMPLSMLWVRAGAAALRARIAAARPDVVVTTGPPMAGVLAARLGLPPDGPPFVVELRDLWAGSPAFDRGGPVLPALERWAFEPADAVVACTPEARDDLLARHPALDGRVHEVPNGFEPELLARRREDPPDPRSGRPLTILHSGTLSVDRPLAPLLRVLAREPYRTAYELVLHGHVVPPILEQVRRAPGVAVRVLPPSTWSDAVELIAACDLALITQARGAGDATAVASKVYEYLALGRPVLCLSDGGATEGLLRRLGAGSGCARLGDEGSIAAALDAVLAGSPPAVPSPERLAPWSRASIAAAMAGRLDAAAAAGGRAAAVSVPVP